MKGLALLIFLICLVCLTLPDPTLAQPPIEQKIAKLISQLGEATKYEEAVIRLSEIGQQAETQLQAAIEGNNALICRRAKLVLANIARRRARQFLHALAAGKADGSTLPGWKQFSKITGDSPEARKLYVEMYRAEPGLMQAYERDFKKAEQLLHARLSYDKMNLLNLKDSESNKMSLDSIAAILFVAGDKRIELSDAMMQKKLCNFLQVDSPTFELIIRGEKKPPGNAPGELRNCKTLRKLIVRWLLHPTFPSKNPHTGYVSLLWKLSVAMDYEIPEGITLAAQLIGDDRILVSDSIHLSAFVKYFAVLAIGRLGDKSHANLLEPLLSRKDEVKFLGRLFFHKNKVQLSDIALFTLLKLSNQRVENYGFVKSKTATEDDLYLDQVRNVYFAFNANRDEALKKWHAWAKENLADEKEGEVEAAKK